MKRRANLRALCILHFPGEKVLSFGTCGHGESVGSACGTCSSLVLQKFASIIFGALAVLSLLVNPPLHLLHDPIARSPGSNVVCVPGRGFSGFWHTLGHLHAINKNIAEDQNNYFCYSSGCLCAVASLSNKTVDEVIDAAVLAQDLWKAGEISRYRIVETFVDTIMIEEDAVDSVVLQKLNILLTTRGTGVTAKVPHTLFELRELLIQTTWIPFVTGSGLWAEDSNGGYQMDGAFSLSLHPPCDYRIDVPYSLDILMNVLNPGLSNAKAKEYWEAGFRHGLEEGLHQ